MVKIKIRVLLSLMVFVIVIMLSNLAHASGENLQISNVDVKVSSKTLRNMSNGETISEEARPDYPVEFRVEVRNNFTRAQDFRIRDITVKTIIEGIDNGEDLEIESDRFDLRADTEKRSFFDFIIPLEVREDAYNVIITAEGEDEDGTNEMAEMRLKLEVDKDNDMLKFIKTSLIPAEISCNRKNVQLAITLLNIGNHDEDGVSLQISNEELGLDIRDKIDTLFARPNEPESRFSKTYLFNVPGNLEAGNYPITLRVLYNDDRNTAEGTVTLIVNSCAKAIAESARPEEGPGVEVITPAETGKTAAQPEIPAGTVVTQESPLKRNILVVGIVIVAAIIAGIVLVVSLFRRKG
ncbi:hypothetical protein HYX03_00340 [Candidatus Woesearchaeota archaeon]|nr:hypothetical protein [Candidatus Woesearchaeota archaeon]